MNDLSEEKDDNPAKDAHEARLEKQKSIVGAIGMFFLEIIKIGILAGVTIWLVRHFFFRPFYVQGQSMEPTYYQNEYLIVDEITYRFREPVRGEVIVFRAPTNQNDFYLKRVIGLPGERIKIEDGKVIVCNTAFPQCRVLDEVYLEEVTPGSSSVTLGASEYFVLGDNRDASYDSRRFGSIERKSIIGRAIFRGWPLTRVGTAVLPEFNL